MNRAVIYCINNINSFLIYKIKLFSFSMLLYIYNFLCKINDGLKEIRQQQSFFFFVLHSVTENKFYLFYFCAQNNTTSSHIFFLIAIKY